MFLICVGTCVRVQTPCMQCMCFVNACKGVHVQCADVFSFIAGGGPLTRFPMQTQM